MIEHEVVYTECTAYKYWFNISDIRDPTDGQTCTGIYDAWRTSLGGDTDFEGDPPTCVCHKTFNVDKIMKETVCKK